MRETEAGEYGCFPRTTLRKEIVKLDPERIEASCFTPEAQRLTASARGNALTKWTRDPSRDRPICDAVSIDGRQAAEGLHFLNQGQHTLLVRL
mmetsp:Transcript_9901/g.20137  ORF Transcript_9901/g.20137 Transcript_9901/m.20137 type:complete len:93 (-) Transcript_9901:604-882(-)